MGMDATLPTARAASAKPALPALAFNVKRVVAVGVVLGLAANILFVDDGPGLNAPLFGTAFLAALFGLSALEGVRPRWRNAWLAAPIAGLLVMVAVRDEPLVVWLNLGLALTLSAVLVRLFQHGDLSQFGLWDYLTHGLWTGFETTLVYPAAAVHAAGRNQGRAYSTQLWAVGRGLVIALPIVLVLAGLLASADPAFSQAWWEALKALKLDNIPELIWRLIVIGAVAWLTLGALSYALGRSAPPVAARTASAGLGLLGATETGVVLLAVNGLFLSFVIIQFQYFFGGDRNIEVAGLTYAEYARRGFFELIAVAVLTLGLGLTLRAITMFRSQRATTAFNLLSAALVVLTGVLLVSAFQRLWLYEDAYGFTRLRTYAHVFIIWLGVALLVFLITTLLNRPRQFILGALGCVLGFVLTLNVFSTDAFITRENIARGTLLTESTLEWLSARYDARAIDSAYLATLSDDAVPELVAALDHPDPIIRAHIAEVLATRIAAFDPEAFTPARWPRWNYARMRAAELLARAQR